MRRFVPHQAWLLTILLSVSAVAVASLPNTFKPGDPLSATKLNENFDALDKRLSDNLGTLETRIAALESKLTPPTSSILLKDATVVLQNRGGPLPITSTTFSTSGEGLLVIATGTAWAQQAQNILDVQVQLDGAPIGDLTVYANATLFHLALPTMIFPVAAPTPGAHTITLVNGSDTTTTDANDVFSVTVVKLSH